MKLTLSALAFALAASMFSGPVYSASAVPSAPVTNIPLPTIAHLSPVQEKEVIDPSQIKYTKDSLREHSQQLYQIYKKTPKGKDSKGKIYYQMMIDCAFISHDLDRHYITYKTADTEEKKMAEILKDGVITDKEIGEWHKDMRTTGINAPPVYGSGAAQTTTKPIYHASHK